MSATCNRYLTKKQLFTCIYQYRLMSKKTMQEDIQISNIKNDLRDIFLAGVKAVKPDEIISKKIKVENDKLYIKDRGSIELNDRVYMIGFGKAVMGMAVIMEKILGHRLKKGIVSIPRGSVSKNDIPENLEISENVHKEENMNSGLSKIVSYRENCVDNQPDERTLITSKEIVDMVKPLDKNDTLIVLISGGGSALLSMPSEKISLDIKLDLCKKLQNSGANIKELNIIRQKLSMVKAGGLARLAYPASVIGLIISDIVGDPIELIASGPTVFNPKDPDKVVDILQKYNLFEDLSKELKLILTSSESEKEKIILDKDMKFKHVKNFIVGNNSSAIDAARIESLRRGFHPIILFDNVDGLVQDISKMYCKLTSLICKAWIQTISKRDFMENLQTDSQLAKIDDEKIDEIFSAIENSEIQKIVLIAGGEPSIVVSGSGKGGRNQHLALTFSLDFFNESKQNNDLFQHFRIVFLSAGTDGQDGPTDAAGAFGYSDIILNTHNLHKKNQCMDSKELTPENSLSSNDSYYFYTNSNGGKDLLKTGLTGTNVMDIHLVCISKES